MTNCPNCAAVVDPGVDRCAYCGTPYPRPGSEISITEDRIEFRIDGKAIASLSYGIMTVNGARRLCGLREVQEMEGG